MRDVRCIALNSSISSLANCDKRSVLIQTMICTDGIYVKLAGRDKLREMIASQSVTRPFFFTTNLTLYFT